MIVITALLDCNTYALRQQRDACDRHEYLDAAHDHEGQVEPAHAQHQAADGRTEHLGKVHHRASQRLNVSRKTTFDVFLLCFNVEYVRIFWPQSIETRWPVRGGGV